MIKITIDYKPESNLEGNLINTTKELKALRLIDDTFIQVELRIKRKLNINLNYQTILKFK